MSVKAYRASYIFKGTDVTFDYYSNGPISAAHTILLLGTVQIGRLPKIVAKHIGPGVVVVQGAPHWLANPDGSDIPEFMYQFTNEAVGEVVRHMPKYNSVRLVADSQAAPGAVRYALQHQNTVRELVLLQPLGLNRSAYTTSPLGVSAEFKRRIAQNFHHQLRWIVTDPNLIYNHAIITHVGIKNARSGIDNDAQYAAGLVYDMAPDLAAICLKLPVTIVLGAKDKIFPNTEISATILKNNIRLHNFIIVPNVPHSPLATRAGKRLLGLIFDAS